MEEWGHLKNAEKDKKVNELDRVQGKRGVYMVTIIPIKCKTVHVGIKYERMRTIDESHSSHHVGDADSFNVVAGLMSERVCPSALCALASLEMATVL